MTTRGSAKAHSQYSEMRSLIRRIDRIRVDHSEIPQERLDLANRSRTSLFPWRGQFSPELIEILLSEYVTVNSVVLDPFLGCGTTLFEAVRRRLETYGVEINPAAVEMARTVIFSKLTLTERKNGIANAKRLLDRALGLLRPVELFSHSEGTDSRTVEKRQQVSKTLLQQASENPFTYNVIINTLMQAAPEPDDWCEALVRSFKKHVAVIESLPYSTKSALAIHGDARVIPLAEKTVDLIVTSPPYINVFNYHQNYRPIMELAGWNLLDIARAEIGSNRKNRGNRFLTVVEYAIDMLDALVEARRVLKPSGRIIVVIGRESTVRGVRFENWRILGGLGVGGAGLDLVLRQERKFKNKFGETIREDILHFKKTSQKHESSDFARGLAQFFLKEALEVTRSEVRDEIEAAIKQAPIIKGSPLFTGTARTS